MTLRRGMADERTTWIHASLLLTAMKKGDHITHQIQGRLPSFSWFSRIANIQAYDDAIESIHERGNGHRDNEGVCSSSWKVCWGSKSKDVQVPFFSLYPFAAWMIYLWMNFYKCVLGTWWSRHLQKKMSVKAIESQGCIMKSVLRWYMLINLLHRQWWISLLLVDDFVHPPNRHHPPNWGLGPEIHIHIVVAQYIRKTLFFS